MAHGARGMAHGTCGRAHGAWRMGHAAGHMVHGAWDMEQGAWCMTAGDSQTRRRLRSVRPLVVAASPLEAAAEGCGGLRTFRTFPFRVGLLHRHHLVGQTHRVLSRGQRPPPLRSINGPPRCGSRCAPGRLA
eukprot:354922-Chlamydomonas_euryale.AAC.4